MTTTHTFQGLNSDNRPSSRVLNPPGGSTSNIFGNDAQAKPNSHARNNPEVSRDKTSTNVPVAAAGPQQKPKGRSGDNSIHTSFGIYPSSGCDKAPSNKRVSILYPGGISENNRRPITTRSKYSKTDTFGTLFGQDSSVRCRNMFRRVHHVNDDSFSRVFGQRSLQDCFEKQIAPATSFMTINKPEKANYAKFTDTRDIYSSQSVYTNLTPKSHSLRNTKSSNTGCITNSHISIVKSIPLFRKLHPLSGFNPITGEPYGQPIEQSEPHKQVEKTNIEGDLCKSSCGDIQLAPVETGNTVDVIPVKSGITEIAASDLPAQEQEQQKQNPLKEQSYTSGAVKEHTSTRVSQPPGGRSSKLW